MAVSYMWLTIGLLALIVSFSIATLLIVNFLFGKLAGHVLVEHATGRSLIAAELIRVAVSSVALAFATATTLIAMLAIVSWTTYNQLPDALRLLVFIVGFGGAGFSALHGLQVVLQARSYPPEEAP